MSNRYKDFNILFTAHPNTKDIAKLYDENAIKQSIKNLILLSPYDIPFHPEIGCNIRTLLFDNATTLTAIHIEQMIRNVIETYEPRVELNYISLNPTSDRNGYDVYISYTIINNPDPSSMNFKLNKLT